MFAQESMRERYVFTDVQLRGYYPSYVLNEWERRGFSIKMEAGDEQILREGTCDYLGFSYYMTNAVKAEGGTGDAISGFEGSVPNPHVKASDWGWQIDPVGYTPWGCIDCVSFTTGQYSKRYGFIYVNKHDDGTGDMSRSRKKSFEWYKTVIASNGETL